MTTLLNKMKCLRGLIVMVMLVAVAQSLKAQPVAYADSARVAGTTVSLVTCYPGSEVYEVYGHSILRVTTPSEDFAVNYGVFDFNEPNFVYRFVKGDAEYRMGLYPGMYIKVGYDGRKMVQQQLNLTFDQKRRVLDYLYWNMLPENVRYNYKYASDNCATRLRDIVEMAVGRDSISYPKPESTPTCREIMKQCGANYAWLQFGIDLALGEGIDHPMDVRQQMFAPLKMMNSFAQTKVKRDGKWVPLVVNTSVINPGSDQGTVEPPTPKWCSPMNLALILLLVTLVLSIHDVRRRKVTLAFDFVLYLMQAICGTIIAFLVLVSIHEATSPNWNLVWLNPIYWIFPLIMWIKSAKKALFYLHLINFAVLIVFFVAMPWLAQTFNVAFYPLVVVSAVRSVSYIAVHKLEDKK